MGPTIFGIDVQRPILDHSAKRRRMFFSNLTKCHIKAHSIAIIIAEILYPVTKYGIRVQVIIMAVEGARM